MAIRIEQVDAGSEAEALGLAPGDELLSVDDNELNDTLDYDFYTDSSSFHLKARVADGIREWEVQRPQRGPFGCGFKTYLGDAKHSCSNHCMFCFIDQLPPGMRESLYFKDDDERLSFLFGNYITMTNMQDHEIDRIIKMHISPINISVHTTNPQLRVRMLANKRGGEVLKYLPRLVEGGIAVNCQLVLCRGVNDGNELRRTLADLLELTPMVQSIAAVPCGITDYRKNLYPQVPYDAKTSAEVIDIMEEFGDECKRRHGKRIIYPSDEWYLKAGRPIPAAAFYEDYDQLENGVGMMRLFEEEFLAELDKPHRVYGTKELDVVTGTMAAPLITRMMEELHRQYPMITVHVHTIQNRFFGGNVGVTGLITATDIIAQCAGKLATKTLGIPAVMLREEKDTFLDDITVEQLGQQLGVKVEVLPTAGGMMWVPEHPFVDAEVLRRGYCLKEYDMRATADNFWTFVDPQHGENLYVSNGIRDLTGLQIIMQRGYGYLMQNAERYWNREFVFRNGFDNIERKYASDLSDEGRAAKREEQYNLAAYILDRKFPIRRRPSSEIPPMQAEGIRTFRNFDAINLLFRPDKLLEAYQRRRDEPVRGTEFHLKRH